MKWILFRRWFISIGEQYLVGFEIPRISTFGWIALLKRSGLWSPGPLPHLPLASSRKPPKNPKDRSTYLGTIDHIDTPMVRSAVLLVGQAMLGNGCGRWNRGSKDFYPDRSTNPTEKCRGATIANLQQATTKRKNPWIRKEPKGFR